jgi:hypothetical protein
MMVILEKVSLSASRSQPQQEMRTKQKKIPPSQFLAEGDRVPEGKGQT